MANDKLLKEQREEIINTLQWFDVRLSAKDESKLNQDNAIVFSSYFDPYLIPLIPTLSQYRNTRGPFSIAQDIKFEGLISLCFAGMVSVTVWDKIWKLLSEKEQLMYSAQNYYLGWPLAIAAKNSNLSALKRLDGIYTNLLYKYPDRAYKMHFALENALKECNDIKNNECLAYLLTMAEKYSKSSDPSKQSLSDKKLNYNKQGLFLSSEESTSLLECYSIVASNYLEKSKFDNFVTLCSYLSQKGMSAEEYEHFKDHILPALTESKKRFSDPTYLESFKYLEQLLESIREGKVSKPESSSSDKEKKIHDLTGASKGSEEQYELLINEKLIPLTKEYLEHLKDVNKGFEDKYKKMNSLLACLENKGKIPNAFDRVEKFYTKLNKYEETITAHRDSQWKRYIKNALIAGGILITGILPGLALLLIYVITGNTAGKSLEYWKSGGQVFFDKSKKEDSLNLNEGAKPSKAPKSNSSFT